jgi:putative hydrolase of the HAD superfamily
MSAPDPNGASSPRPQAILFDLFHTLVNVNEAPGPGTPSILGLDHDRWIEQVFHHSPHHALGEEPDAFESLRRIAHAIDPTVPVEKIRAAVIVRRARFRHALIHVREDIVQALDEIRGMGRKTALVSNASLDEIESWPESPLASRMDATLFSCHEKIAKPDPEIYRRAARRLDVAPERCVFVGDGGSFEHRGAREAGMRSILILGMLEEASARAVAARERDVEWKVTTFPELVRLVASL